MRIYQCLTCLSGVVFCSMLASCAGFSLDHGSLSQRVVKQAFDYVPVADYYNVSRQQHYPLSGQADLYVEGHDDALVEHFSSALRHHFKSVSHGDNAGIKPHTGFRLNVVELSSNGSVVDNVAAEISSLDKTSSFSEPQSARQQFRVTVSDIDSDEPFDSVTISLTRQGLLTDKSLLDKAMMSAAAKLAGGS